MLIGTILCFCKCRIGAKLWGRCSRVIQFPLGSIRYNKWLKWNWPALLTAWTAKLQWSFLDRDLHLVFAIWADNAPSFLCYEDGHFVTPFIVFVGYNFCTLKVQHSKSDHSGSVYEIIQFGVILVHLDSISLLSLAPVSNKRLILV